MLIAPWHIIVATITAAVTALGGVGLVGVQTFDKARQEAIGSANTVIERTAEEIENQSARLNDLESAIENAEIIYSESEGKILDDTLRVNLNNTIKQAEDLLDEQSEELLVLKKALRELHNVDMEGIFWPENVTDYASKVSLLAENIDEEVVNKVQNIGEKIQAVQISQQEWQKEQDLIAAQKAEEEARAAARAAEAARRAAQSQTIEQSGGQTAPTAPIPPSTAAGRTAVAGFDAVSYIKALAPNAIVNWDEGVCERVLKQVVWLCGFAVVDTSAPKTAPVYIYLDSKFTDRYSTPIGIAVLVHEAAHAKQFFTYGGAMLPEPTSAPRTNGELTVASIEWMADCATIAKLNYSTGSYVKPGQTCTAEQFAEAGSIW